MSKNNLKYNMILIHYYLIINLKNNIKNHYSHFVKDNKGFFDKLRTTYEQLFYKSKDTLNANKIEEIFKILDGEIIQNTEYNKFNLVSYGSSPYVNGVNGYTNNQLYINLFNDYQKTKTNHLKLFYECLKENEGTDLSNFFNNNSILNILESHMDVTATQKQLETFFIEVKKINLKIIS